MFEETKITATSMQLMEDAPYTVAVYMGKGRDIIDNLFGEGYAAKHPELLAAFMAASAVDMAGAMIARSLDHLPERLSEVTYGLQGSLQDICGAISDAAAK
jgi:hypothetical protein